MGSYSPPWIRRGGRDLKKISRSLLVGSGRGGSFKLPIIGGLNQPFLRLRAIALALRARMRELVWYRGLTNPTSKSISTVFIGQQYMVAKEPV
jgi:hypothetical protein